MIDEVIAHAEEQMEKSLANLDHEFVSIRTGRASAAVLERIQISYYGTPTPITQVAGVKSPEAHLLVIEPWYKSILRDIEKAILGSDLGITPSNDGSILRLPFPPPTEERRRELVKQCRQLAEESKVAVRNIRRDANSRLEKLIKEEDVSKDEVHRGEEQIQKITDKHIVKIDEALKRKEAEVMEV